MCMVYARANIFGMSYYSISFLMLMCALCCVPIMIKKEYQMRSRRLAGIMLGIFFSCSVLCCPYYAAFVPMIALMFFKKDTRSLVLWTFLSVILCACVYIILFLPLDDFPLLLESLKTRSASVMPGGKRGPLSMLRAASDNLFMHTKTEREIAVIFSLAVIVFWKIKHRIPEIIWLIHHTVSLLYLMSHLPGTVRTVCHFMLVRFDILMLPVALYVLISKKARLPLLLYITGVAAAFLFGMASNTHIDAMTSGFCITFIGALMMLPLIHHTSGNSVLYRAVQAVTVLAILAAMLPSYCQRYIGVYRDAPIQQLNTVIEKGPAKGLRTTEEHARQYGIIFDTIQRIHAQDPDASVMHSKNLPWAYLCNDWEIGTYTVWSSLFASGQMEAYYARNPNKVPDYVFLYEPNTSSFERSPFNDHYPSDTYNDQELSGEFYDRMIEESEIIEQNEFVTVYRLTESEETRE